MGGKSVPAYQSPASVRGAAPTSGGTAARGIYIPSIDPYAPASTAPAYSNILPEGTVDLSPPKPESADSIEKRRRADVEKDQALLAGKNQDLLNKRVFDMARVRNRSKDYQAPTLGGDMTGSRKRLLGQ